MWNLANYARPSSKSDKIKHESERANKLAKELKGKYPLVRMSVIVLFWYDKIL